QHGELDTRFHQLIYDRHYNRHAADLWWKHREILRAISRRFPTSLSRMQAVLREHRELIEAIRAQDADRAAEVVARHVEGSGRHIIEQMGVAKRNGPRRGSASG
ncbi:MAG: GntR family transcriptional regulator, partial [Hyphomicrobiales bacterium]